MSTSFKLPVSVDEYLEAEHTAGVRSEYLDGKVFAMSGASRRHVLITTNLVFALKQALRSRDCNVYASDMRLKVPAGLFTYPDVMVTCGKEQILTGPTDTLLNPVLILEVLSKSTRNYDRGDKFHDYRSMPSLREYLTVEQDLAQIEHCIRVENNEWLLKDHTSFEGKIQLMVGAELRLDEVYERITFDSGEPPDATLDG